MIRLEDIRKQFGATIALDSFTLTIPTGETTVLLGPSGCGKSTLIRIINGLVSPDSGAVYIDGKRLISQNLRQLRRRIGYVVQQGGLFPHMTAKQNVALMAAYLGWPKNRIESSIRALAHLTSFPSEGLDRYPLQLSGGQNQRISLMRALMLDPDILLLDEPLAALDPLIRFELQRDLKNIFRNLRKTVVLVTHDLAEASYFSRHIVLIRQGAIVQLGSIREMIERPSEPFVTRFIQAQRTLLQPAGAEEE